MNWVRLAFASGYVRPLLRLESEFFIKHIKGLIETIESIEQFILVYDEGGCTVDVRVPMQTVQSIFLVGFLVLNEGLVCFLMLQSGDRTVWIVNVKATKQSHSTVLLDAGMVVRDVVHAFLKDRTDFVPHVIDYVILDKVLDGLICRSHRHGMCLVR